MTLIGKIGIRLRETQFNRARRLLLCGSLVALLGIVGTEPVVAQQLRLPPLVEPASQEHHIGKVILVELVTPDIAASKQFYSGLFGWTYRDIQAGATTYVQASLNGRPVAGLIYKAMSAGARQQPAWLSFFAVNDVDAAQKIALQRGAKLLFGPRTFPDRGRQAVFADPQGATFALLASSNGDPPDFLAAPGEWIWSSLFTNDPGTEAGFYQALFDYDVFELPDSAGAHHLLLASRNYARASANTLPGDAHAYWLNYVRVDDAVDAAARAVALGGRVLVEPRSDRHGGKVAVIADPQGALVGLLEWPDTRGKEVSK